MEKPSVGNLKEKKLSLFLAAALAFSAACEKAKNWTGADLAKFNEAHPNAERVDKKKIDMVAETIHKFNESAEQGGPKVVDFYGEHHDDNNFRVEEDKVTALGNDIVAFGYAYSYRRDNSQRLTPGNHDTIIKLVYNPEKDRYIVIVKDGSNLSFNIDKKADTTETMIDRDTGLVISQTANTYHHGHAWTDDEESSFELVVGANGNLEVSKGDDYVVGNGQKSAARAIEQVERLSKRLVPQKAK